MRIVPIALSLFILAACGGESSTDTSTSSADASKDQAQTPVAKKQVVYYVMSPN